MSAINLFISMDTQWIWAEGYRVGLRYDALPEVWRRQRIPPSQRDELFEDLRVLERGAICQLSEDASQRNE